MANTKKTTTKKFSAPPVSKNFLKPLQDRIIVTATPPETQSVGGIIIPDTAQEQQNKGYIMAVGPKVGKDGVELKVGDLVAYGEYAGTEIDHEGIEYLIMREADILYKL